MHRNILSGIIAIIVLSGIFAAAMMYQNRNKATADSPVTSGAKAASDTSEQNGQQPDPTTDAQAEDAGVVVDPADVAADSVRVTMAAGSYAPAAVSITSGTTVVWTNNDTTEHTVTGSGTDGPKSKTLASGESFAYMFTKIGTYTYKSQGNPEARGTITVTE